jgi:Flp pilus assembly protein TadD
MAMFRNRQILCAAAIAIAGLAPQALQAGDLKINLPRRSSPTPVQRLNREGVEAVRKHQYQKAETLFYKAYLYDPGDPFTLNNLGYISELQGEVDRAKNFYSLASEQASNAAIYRASSKKLEGKPMKDAVAGMQDASMRINRDNVEAIRLLSKGRGPEAEQLLQQTLTLNPRNAFTLNNMGVVKEEEGDLEGAFKYYTAAADLHSEDPVVVTLQSSWRGVPVSKMAEDSAKKVSQRMHSWQTPEARANLLALRGVYAVNRNDWTTADQDFRQAYTLDPADAFSLNNAGYVAEIEGDKETAQFFYDKALKAQGSESEVGLATHGFAEGLKLTEVATENGEKVDSSIEQQRELRRQQAGPIELKRRDNTPIEETQPETQPPSESTPPPTAGASQPEGSNTPEATQPAQHYVPRPATPMQPPDPQPQQP